MISDELWERLQKSFTFKKWYEKRVERCTRNLYDFRTKKLINPKVFNTIVIPDIPMFVDFVLDLNATMHISISSVEKNPIIVCNIQYLNIEVKRIAKSIEEAVSIATCEFALEYDIKQILRKGAD